MRPEGRVTVELPPTVNVFASELPHVFPNLAPNVASRETSAVAKMSAEVVAFSPYLVPMLPSKLLELFTVLVTLKLPFTVAGRL
jgi:hypothetical protein